MPVDAIVAAGLRLWYSTDGGSTWLELTDLEKVGEPMAKESPDVPLTTLTQTAQEFAAGLQNNGTLDFTQYWNKTRYGVLNAQYGKTIDWKISYPDAALEANKTKMVAKGYINRLAPSGADSQDTPLTITCKVKITGAVAFTAGS